MYSLLPLDDDQSVALDELISSIRFGIGGKSASSSTVLTNGGTPPAVAVKYELPLDIFVNVFDELRVPAVAIEAPLPNRIRGRYQSVDEYLYTQMLLLRTDFFAYLQKGIQQLRNKPVRVPDGPPGFYRRAPNTVFWRYNSKRIELLQQHDTHIKHIVRLLPDDMSRVNRCRGRGNTDEDISYVPFMEGSLLLFTSSVRLDDLLLASVVKLNKEEKWVHIHILRAHNPLPFIDLPLIMLECMCFFNPHFQLHRTLGTLRTASFPLFQQLIRVSRKPVPPDYLDRRTPTVYRTPDGRHELPLYPATAAWPSPDEIGYNASQTAAIRHALTHRVAMIQGPPGTGKSFVGRELVGLLLHNTKHRIVIVCNSNQALDQFLLGLLATYCQPTTGYGVVRMGSQCREPVLESIVNRPWQWSTVSADLLRKAFEQISSCTLKADCSMRDMAQGKQRKALNEGLEKGVAERRALAKIYQDNQYEQIKRKRVVGMTSSFAANNRHLLMRLKAPIVIVEEAAELLEAHVIAALTKHTQHLIQIGDHLQLRPKTFLHASAVKYRMDVSLFERLHNNKLPAAALSQQHRMHPGLAELIRPSIYKVLTDAPEVHDYQAVRGMPARLTFMDHRHPEEAVGTSKRNFGEARLVQGLCAYLRWQGYTPDDITVLCTYRAQANLLQTDPAHYGLCHGCPIAIVDSFQGRQSRIVLVSLVRNNDSDRVGYMQAANRACVALSRAREGLYLFGNLQMLAKENPAWQHVQQLLRQMQYGIEYGVLTVRCERHGRDTPVVEPNDFDQVIKHGCRDCLMTPDRKKKEKKRR